MIKLTPRTQRFQRYGTTVEIYDLVLENHPYQLGGLPLALPPNTTVALTDVGDRPDLFVAWDPVIHKLRVYERQAMSWIEYRRTASITGRWRVWVISTTRWQSVKK